MNKITKNILSVTVLAFCMSAIANAQITQQKIGTNPTIIKPSAVLDIESANKGVLMPRISLKSTTDVLTILTPEDALTVFNMATAGTAPNDVVPGYYYFSVAENKWIKLATIKDAIEPWNVFNSTNKATANTDNIFQMGKVAINTNISTKQFEVAGDLKAAMLKDGRYFGIETNVDESGISAIYNFNNADMNAATEKTLISLMPNNISQIAETESNFASSTIGAGVIEYHAGNDGKTDKVSSLILNKDQILLSSIKANGSNSSIIRVQETLGIQFNFGLTSGVSQGSYTFPRVGGKPNQVLVTDGGLLGDGQQAQLRWEDATNGPKGDKGDPGTNGAIGATGPKGDTGATGTNGAIGATGLTGPKGDTGTNGTNGAIGATGLTGATGPKGDTGTNGTNGAIGATGLTGPKGDAGLAGTNGTNGTQGIQGLKGDKGDTGAAGQGGVTTAGTNVTVVGSGTVGIPYVVNAIIPATTYTLVNPVNTITSVVNGVSVTATVVNTNVLSLSGNNLVSTINGVPSTGTLDLTTLEPWNVQGGTTKATTNAQAIYQTGAVAIGTSTIPPLTVGTTTITPKFHVAGDISTTGKVWTTNSVYADYVFEKYFKGTSVINPNYEFKSLNYVKDFIKANHHLPGVASIDELRKAENGYTFDMTKLTIQSLEKIEELYLHTIEQKEKIDLQQAEIDSLKKASKDAMLRLERLEKLLVTGDK